MSVTGGGRMALDVYKETLAQYEMAKAAYLSLAGSQAAVGGDVSDQGRSISTSAAVQNAYTRMTDLLEKLRKMQPAEVTTHIVTGW